MKRASLIFLLTICFLLLTLTTPSAAGHDYWGALAYSSATGSYGFAYDYSTKAEAINHAVGKCAARDCHAVVWFHNGCGAFARGPHAWGWGIGDNRHAAEETALAECRKVGGGCQIVEWACTTR